MFHVDVTMEDTRIVAVETDTPGLMTVAFHDAVTGKRFVKDLRLATLGAVLTVALTGDDDNVVTRQELDAIFADCPNECRPIP